MSYEILYVLLPDFASHEMAYLMKAISSDGRQLRPSPRYVNRTVAPGSGPVAAIGGFRMLPDYSSGNMSDGRMVTASGSGVLEFSRGLLLLLENDTTGRIEKDYQFNRQGFCNLFPR